MDDHHILERKREEIGEGEEEVIDLDKISVREENGNQFPPDLIHDPPQNYSEDQRQTLYQKILKMSTPEKIRLAILGNREARNLLIHSPNKMISLAVLRSPKLTENEILKYAQQKNLSEDIILAIAKNQKWIKSYPIKQAIIGNPKTPLSVAINFLSHLHDYDLKLLSRDKNVSSVLSRSAHQVRLKRNISK